MYFRLQSVSASFGLHSAHSHHKRFTVCSHRHMQILFIAVSFYLLLSIFSVIVILLLSLLSTSLYFALFLKKKIVKRGRALVACLRIVVGVHILSSSIQLKPSMIVPLREWNDFPLPHFMQTNILTFAFAVPPHSVFERFLWILFLLLSANIVGSFHLHGSIVREGSSCCCCAWWKDAEQSVLCRLGSSYLLIGKCHVWLSLLWTVNEMAHSLSDAKYLQKQLHQ